MYALSVMLRVKPEHVDDFRKAALAHANNTKTNETGCLAFEVFESPEQPGLFYFHEAYESRQAVEDVHNKATYFADFGQKTGAWIESKDIHSWQSLS